MGRKGPWFALNGTRVFSWTDTVTAQLEERRQRDRGPYVQQLANLHYQTMTLMALHDFGSTA
jgi:hypothetical protein